MNRYLAMAMALVLGAVMSSTAFAQKGSKADANHIICKLTHPWPWGCNHDGYGNDADGDGVADNKDKCPGTRRGAAVDAGGCPTDADKDGVADGIDTCPGTPAGVAVNSDGCPEDSDRDGVFDGADKCPGTPRGATVNVAGCPSDADKDGVFDGVDTCPNTDVQWAVDKKGCPIPVSETYQQFLDAKEVSTAIEFESGKADLKPTSEDILNRVGEVLNDWPEAEVEIGGHTDAQGSDQFNRTLSGQRAEAVKSWLTSHYKNIKSSNLSAKGYGESDPIASNDTPEGRAQNRRVTFTLKNANELSKDIETRRYKKRSE